MMLLSAAAIFMLLAVPARATSVDLLFAYGRLDGAGLGQSRHPDRAGFSISRISLIEWSGDGVPTEDIAKIVSGYLPETIFVDVGGSNVILDEPAYATGFSQMLGTVRAATSSSYHRMSDPLMQYFASARTTINRYPSTALTLFEPLVGTNIVEPSAFLEQGNASMVAVNFGNVPRDGGSYRPTSELYGQSGKALWTNESVLPLPGALWIVLFGLFLLAMLRNRQYTDEQSGVKPS